MKRYLIITIFMINAIIMFSQQNLNIPVPPSGDNELDRIVGYARTLSNFDGSAKSYSTLKSVINTLNSKGINKLKKHQSYTVLGDVYMFGAIYLAKENKDDKTIELYKKALELRADPTSNYELAKIYKNKYDEAVKNNDKNKEKEYGKNVYTYLSKYILLSGNKNSKYKEVVDYFTKYK